MTSQEKKDILRAFRKFQLQRENYYFPRIKKVLTDQYLQGIQKKVVDFHPLFTLLSKMYMDIGKVWAHKIHLSIKREAVKSRQPIGFSYRLFEILKQHYGIDLLKNSLDITETTRQEIQKLLTEAAANGLSINELTHMIQGQSFTAVRARLIARTETVGAANVAGDIIASESGLKMNKEWLAILDNRTRIDHENVHGTIIDQNEKFMVGGVPMRFPGDKGTDGVDVPAKEVCNCRCVCVYHPKRDENGRLL